MTTKNPLNTSGFTLTEFMVAGAITFIFAGVFIALSMGMQRQMAQQSVYYDTNRAVRYAMDRISKDAKEAIGIVANQGGDVTGDDTLVLKLPSIDAQGVPTGVVNGVITEFDHVVYKLDPDDPTRLVRSLIVFEESAREGGNDESNILIAKKIETLFFSYNVAGGTGGQGLSAVADVAALPHVNVQITAQGTTIDRTQSSSVSSDIMFRNF